jgi:LacI family transcriptional regulator, galactose operon repressor
MTRDVDCLTTYAYYDSSALAATTRDVAREAGVSQSTVSRALNGDPRVAPETRALIQAAAKRLSYLPNTAARSLITKRTDTIGILIGEITNPFYPQLVDVLHDEFTLSGFRTVLLNERADAGRADELFPQLQGRFVDGIVIANAMLGATFVDDFDRQGIPVVLLNRDVDDAHVDRVVSDNVGGGEVAAQTLVELGHRRIGLIGGPANASTARDRALGFERGLARAGLEVAARRVGEFTHQSGYQWCLDLLREPSPPTAIFAANDVIAFGVLDAAKRMGVRVPEDLSVIGYDDIEMAGWELFGLTTVRQPLAQMAKAAARMLIERIEGRVVREPARLVFPANLVRRQTTTYA